MRLVLFDLDNTLLAGDSDYEWGQSLIDRGVVDRAHHEARNQAVYGDYKAGRLDIYAFLNFSLRPLATHTRAQLDAWHAEYKITRLEQFLDHHGTRLDCLTSRRFYSDSLNDLPLLEKG